MVPKEQQPVSVYGGYMKEIAELTETVFFNVISYMMNEYNELGMALTRSTYYIDDNVHLNDYGAQYLCNAILDMILNSSETENLKSMIK